MAVLVTGGAGYIGSHMVLALLDAGEHVVVVDDLSTGFSKAVDKRAKLYVNDFSDINILLNLHNKYNFDAVLHFAGSVVVPESVQNPLKYFSNNTCKSLALLKFIVESSIPHVVFSSTAAVYGTPQSGELVSEESRLAPESPYGLSKLMTEQMLRDASSAHNFCYAALRYFNVAGADPLRRAGQSTDGATHLIKVACEVATGKRDSIWIYGTDYPTPDGTCIRDFIHVSDLVSAHVCALSYLRKAKRSIIANLGYGRGHSVRDVLAAVERVSGCVLRVIPTERRPGDAVKVVANATLARDVLEWAPMHDDLNKIVESALAWEGGSNFRVPYTP
ncbi:UDP-glucose 4-epimerase GalE [Asticcacaulis sp. DW145]|uniref:UDP-glucose 4-epimerase GalE n=1 Tax=Asticcacaulis sp. DW145 TaxID=3095608 RepID=UPI003091078F|nr:UDP-glucose 4-epimerase GalE [Asticcacaulis sp. DW145]